MLAAMQLPWLADDTPFPPTALALDDTTDAPGLLAVGGGLGVARLRAAYARGIFPWYSEGQPVLWWSPDPRMVLPVAEFKLSRSLRKSVQRFAASQHCQLRMDTAFEAVMQACATAPREGQLGTWILPEMIAAYTRLHRAGQAHSVETWIDGELVGGLYAINLGGMVFGESMFARRTDASKIALAALVAFCREHGMGLIDCQQHTRHLASLGARAIPRPQFEARLDDAVNRPGPAHWFYDPAYWAHVLATPASRAADTPADRHP
jgi:leucyl/phenylalanyl-tRNA--protein transferase